MARDGEQSGAAQWAFANAIPRFASRSMCGVLTCGCPPRNPTQSFKSSTAMKSTLGRSGACARIGVPSTAVTMQAIAQTVMLR